MTLDDALADLAATGNELPRDALRWLLDHWDEAGPRLVAVLDSYARGHDRSERTERALFFAVHLLGEKAEAADAFVREIALMALAYLTRTGRVLEAEMRAYLRLRTASGPAA